jgi:hypothetical protein
MLYLREDYLYHFGCMRLKRLVLKFFKQSPFGNNIAAGAPKDELVR